MNIPPCTIHHFILYHIWFAWEGELNCNLDRLYALRSISFKVRINVIIDTVFKHGRQVSFSVALVLGVHSCVYEF